MSPFIAFRPRNGGEVQLFDPMGCYMLGFPNGLIHSRGRGQQGAAGVRSKKQQARELCALGYGLSDKH